MSRRCDIEYAIAAVEDLEGIRAWYAGRQVPEVGERLIRDVVEQVDRLARFPESGRIVPEFEVPFLREIIHPPFRVVYRLNDDHISVVRVYRSERELDVSQT